MNLEIKIAHHAGYCYGVERAINIAKKALSAGSQVVSLGPIIHNPIVVKELSSSGIRVVESVEEVPPGAVVVIRSHGVPPDVYRELEEKQAKIIDATCPYVRRAQVAAKKLSDEGYTVLIVGEKDHPEVVGIKGYAGDSAFVIEKTEELSKVPYQKRLGVVFQTTQSLETIDIFAAEIVKKAFELRLFNTICSATTDRQNETREIAAESDVVIVVGGKNSGNTKRLYEIAKGINPNTYHVESEMDLKKEWFIRVEKVGITAGASTPKEIVQRVAEAVKNLA
ncbi:MAG: 4-hydroxy-3-methylbut-2-enyl diphosphate reductase [Actinobacteria bacterium]|nr:4-hydroxy-3-methylbut-2-enyl diphosphate reductase [Actinomycetota bacterium]